MMPLYRRPNKKSDAANASSKDTNSDDPKEHSKRPPPKEKNSATTKKATPLTTLGLFSIQLVLLCYVWMRMRTKSSSQTMAILATAWVVSFPVILILGVGLGILGASSSDTQLPHQQYVPLATVATIAANQIPVFLSCGMAATAITAFGIASRPIPQSSSTVEKTGGEGKGVSGPIKAILGILLMTSVLLTENFFIWVVSATYKASQDLKSLPKPLQDNGQLVLRHFLDSILDLTKRDVVKLRNMINVEWILVSGLGLSMIAVVMNGKAMGRNLYSLALRAVLTLAAARTIRTISFLITVLPSQNPHCYFSHFPVPPPEDWSTWLLTGFIPQANGGCNDLIISGHATVTSTLACVVTSVVGNPLFTSALWTFVAIDYMVEVYEGFHYSVDMWLGAVLVNFIWSSLAWIEGDYKKNIQGVSTRQFYSFSDATKSDWLQYAIPAVVAYLQIIGLLLPEDKANYTIVAFIITIIYQVSTKGFQQYTQHCLFCLLYVALGIYL